MIRQRGNMLIVYAVVALIFVAVVGGGIYKIHRAGYEAGKAEIQAEWNEAVDAQALAEVQQSAGAAKSLEAGNVKARIVYRTITQSVDRYIDRPVYRNLCFDSDGLRDAQAALAGTTAPPAKPDAAVPATDTPSRWLGGLRSKKAD